MPDFQHRDCTLVYDDHPGPAERAPVLLLHGLGSSARDWEYQLPALLGRYRLLVPDLRGHGRSGKPRGGYSMAGFADDCAALLDRLGCGPVHLVGISTYLASLDAIIGWGVQERLAEIACPTLVISADRDYTPVSLKQAYCERIADARLVVVEDSRHATPMDQPEIFNTTLLGFLADIDKTKEQPCSNVS